VSRSRGLRRIRLNIAFGVAALSLGAPSGAAASTMSAHMGTLTLGLAPNHHSKVAGGTISEQPGLASYNWSGYAVTSSTPYRSVTGNWTVPTVTGPNGSYSSAWVGIDGVNNQSLIQTGTEQDYSSNHGSYYAWWTTSAQNFAEQTITSGCTTAAPNGPAAAPRAANFNFGGGGRSAAPSATTGSASNVTSSGATLNGTVNPRDLSTTYYFEYGTTTNYGSTTPETPAGSGSRGVAVSAVLSGLSSGTTYDFQLVATNSKGTAYGGNATFTTTSSGGGGGGGGSASCGTVAPGDHMSASIAETGTTTTWTLSLSDTTGGWTFTTSLTYTGPGASAEWVLEAPSLCSIFSCTTATLANYGTVTFDQGTANGGNPGLIANDGIEMVNSSDTAVISIPSAPDSDTDGFTVAYGSTAPNPPSS